MSIDRFEAVVRRSFLLSAAVLMAGRVVQADAAQPESKPYSAAAMRPTRWAEPLRESGVPNLHRMAPDVFRSAQPRRQDLKALHALGIRTVVSLRSFHGDAAVFAGSGIRLVSIPINTWSIGEDQVARAVAAMRDARQDGAVLLHCLHGADRTGLVSAMWRIHEQGWAKSEAGQEMFEGGYGYHTLWRNIPAFLERLDAAALRERIDRLPPQR